MKSFKLYVVFLMVLGMAISCADENRAFKPKATLGALGTAATRTASTPESEEDKKKAAEEQAKKDAEQAKKDAEQKKKDDQVAKTVLDDGQKQQQIESFQNGNGKGGDQTQANSGTSIAVKPNPTAPAAGGAAKPQQQTGGNDNKLNVAAQTDEERAYFADEKKRLEASKTILGVSAFRAVEADQNNIQIEVLSLIKIGDKDESIVSRGQVTMAGAGENGLRRNMNSMISRPDNDYAMDDIVSVSASCVLDQEKASTIAHCDNILVIIGVKTVTSKNGKEEAVVAYGGYQFQVPASAQPSKYKSMIAMEAVGTTVGSKSFKYYEDALGWTRMPKQEEKEAVAKEASKSNGIEQVNIDDMSKEAAKGREAQDDKQGEAGKDQPLVKDPFEQQQKDIEELRNHEAKQIQDVQGAKNESKDVKSNSAAMTIEQVNVPEMSLEASKHQQTLNEDAYMDKKRKDYDLYERDDRWEITKEVQRKWYNIQAWWNNEPGLTETAK